MITVTSKGDFSKTFGFLERLQEGLKISTLDKYGKAGVQALSEATPKDTGETASSWTYSIEHNVGSVSIIFNNGHEVNGENIALLLQYGHGTGTGGYVQGRDYINPAIQPVFDGLAESAWKEVIG